MEAQVLICCCKFLTFFDWRGQQRGYEIGVTPRITGTWIYWAPVVGVNFACIDCSITMAYIGDLMVVWIEQSVLANRLNSGPDCAT